MDQDRLAATFRAQELLRRKDRQQRLINELRLLEEKLTPEEQAIHNKVITSFQEAHIAFEKETTPSYWKRLWAAIRNK